MNEENVKKYTNALFDNVEHYMDEKVVVSWLV